MEKIVITLTTEQAKELKPLFDIIAARNSQSLNFDFAIVAQPEVKDTMANKVELTCVLVDKIARDTIHNAVKDMKLREQQAEAMRDAIKKTKRASKERQP